MRSGRRLARFVTVGGVVVLAVALVAVLARPVRLQTGNNGVDGTGPVAVVPVGQTACQSIAGTPPETHAVSVGAVGPVRLAATFFAGGGAPARGTGSGAGTVVVALSPPPVTGRGPGGLCLRNLGPRAAALQGAGVGKFARIEGRRARGTLFVAWMGRRRATGAQLGDIAGRVGSGKAQPFGALLLLVLAALMALALGAALLAVARDDPS